MKKKEIVYRIILCILILLVLLFLIRLINPTEIDDVSPGIFCSEIQQYNPDVLYVIPDYEDHPLSFYPEWCSYILSLNKDIGMHGVTHTYKEFLYNDISQGELDFGISEFQKCFGYPPEMFKPPQLAISNKNKQLIKENNLKFRGSLNQLTHKVYHCSDSDKIPNKIVNIF
jgi:predicted deacetylase